MVRRQVNRVLASPSFHASERNRRFLRFVVEETLEGRGERIKAFSIATEVFGRPVSFDAQADPIVRIEAGKLRQALERYFEIDGKDDPVRIVIPKGSYVPVFSHNLAGPDAAAGSEAAAQPSGRRTTAGPSRLSLLALAASLVVVAMVAGLAQLYRTQTGAGGLAGSAGRAPSMLVIPFESEQPGEASQMLAKGFTREIIVGLTRFTDLFVYGPHTSFANPMDEAARRALQTQPADYHLTGTASLDADTVRVSASLVDRRSGRYVWSKSFTQKATPADIIRTREQIANRIVQVVAQPYGVVFREKVRELEGRPPDSFDSYECVLRFHQYWRTSEPGMYRTVRTCLERAVATEPGYAEAAAALSLVYADAHRYGLDRDLLKFDVLDRALQLSRQAIAAAPHSILGYKASHLAHYLQLDVAASFAAARAGLGLNPNDTELMMDYAARLCLTGDWEQGLPLLHDAIARNPALPRLYNVVLSLDAYLRGDHRRALDLVAALDMPGLVYSHVLTAMSHARLGNTHQTAEAVGRLLEVYPNYGRHVREDLRKRNVAPEIVEEVLAGLRLAGLAVDETQ